jgi:hypothetical protein
MDSVPFLSFHCARCRASLAAATGYPAWNNKEKALIDTQTRYLHINERLCSFARIIRPYKLSVKKFFFTIPDKNSATFRSIFRKFFLKRCNLYGKIIDIKGEDPTTGRKEMDFYE